MAEQKKKEARVTKPAEAEDAASTSVLPKKGERI